MIFSIRDLSFELGSMLLEGWPAFAARAVCALLILLAAWLVRRWLTHKGFPALEARSWHFHRHAHPAAQLCGAGAAHVHGGGHLSGRFQPAVGHSRLCASCS